MRRHRRGTGIGTSTRLRFAALGAVSLTLGFGAPAEAAVAEGWFEDAAGSPISLSAQKVYPEAPAAGDFNADGHADLMVGHRPYRFAMDAVSSVSVYLGDGDGGFSLAPDSPFPVEHAIPGVDQPVVGDFNEDGHLDAVIGHGQGLLIGDGTGRFTERDGPGSGGPESITAAGDVNGDGHLDLITPVPRIGPIVRDTCLRRESEISFIRIALGDGAGAFSEAANGPVNTGWGSSRVTLLDVDADSDLDIAVSNEGQICRHSPFFWPGGDVRIFLNDGSAGFTEGAGSPLLGGDRITPREIFASDIDGDGDPDLIVSVMPSDGSAGFSIAVLINDDGRFREDTTRVPADAFLLPYGLGDFDGDGDPDIAGRFGEAWTVLFNNGLGEFLSVTRATSYPPGAFERGAITDLDEDGRDDVPFTEGRFGERDDRLFVLLSRFEAVSDLRIEGFGHPVDMGVTNLARAGQVIPLAFEVFDGALEVRDRTDVVRIFAAKSSCGAGPSTQDDIEQYAAGRTELRWDVDADRYLFTWKTPRTATGCWTVSLTVGDGYSADSLRAHFRFR